MALLPGRSRPDDDLPETVIAPRRGWISINWKELFEFRELLYFLAERDVKIRYKQTVLGVAWAVIQPLCTMLIFTFIFKRLANLPSEGLPYPVFVFAGLIPWMFFAGGVTAAGQSLILQQGIVTKVYFPRLFIPTATLGAYLVDMAVSFGLYTLVLAYYGVVPSWQVVFLPLLVLLTIVATLGLGYSLAALIVQFRDFRHTLSFMIQILMFASPVIYSIRMVPTQYRRVMALNPMAGIIDAYRSCIKGHDWDPVTLAISTSVALVLFVFGIYYFRKTERLFADLA
jgi:lipopolysaccharide transport system permease protein